jgi:hypothetical protein
VGAVFLRNMQLPFREAGRRRSPQGERPHEAAAERLRHLRHENSAQTAGNVLFNVVQINPFTSLIFIRLDQGILMGEVSLYHRPPV